MFEVQHIVAQGGIQLRINIDLSCEPSFWSKFRYIARTTNGNNHGYNILRIKLYLNFFQHVCLFFAEPTTHMTCEGANHLPICPERQQVNFSSLLIKNRHDYQLNNGMGEWSQVLICGVKMSAAVNCMFLSKANTWTLPDVKKRHDNKKSHFAQKKKLKSCR